MKRIAFNTCIYRPNGGSEASHRKVPTVTLGSVLSYLAVVAAGRLFLQINEDEVHFRVFQSGSLSVDPFFS